MDGVPFVDGSHPRLASPIRASRPWRHGAAARASALVAWRMLAPTFELFGAFRGGSTARRLITCVPTGAPPPSSHNSRRAVSAASDDGRGSRIPRAHPHAQTRGVRSPSTPSSAPECPISSSSSSSPSQTNPSSLTRVPSRTHAGPAGFASAPRGAPPSGAPPRRRRRARRRHGRDRAQGGRHDVRGLRRVRHRGASNGASRTASSPWTSTSRRRWCAWGSTRRARWRD